MGKDFTKVINSSKLKNSSSEQVFQLTPNTLTDFPLDGLLDPIVDLM